MEITASGITKRFGERVALSGFGQTFRSGAITAVVGPNGSGKSTLLRVLARLEDPDSGTLVYRDGGREVPHGLSLMRRMTLVAQKPVLFDASLRDNVAYGLKVRGVPGPEIAARVNEALSAGGLEGLASVRAATLSGGEAQKAALARAYALRPTTVLLDEPTASMDPENTALAEGMIMRMRDEFGAAVIMVTHNFHQARRLADTVVIMFGGELVESGDVRDVFERPVRELTRRYLSGEVVC